MARSSPSDKYGGPKRVLLVLAAVLVVAGGPSVFSRVVRSRTAERGFEWDERLDLAFAKARNAAADAQIETATMKYVETNGHIALPDWNTRGSRGVTFTFRSALGATPPPKAMLGAPATGGGDCKVISVDFNPDTGWFTADNANVQVTDGRGNACAESTDERPRCTTAQVWEKAIAAGAPHPALASVQLRTGRDKTLTTLHSWRFEIVDRTTSVPVFMKYLPDDC
jgi:hypothetical protein